ncbi:MAG: DUF3570 domain-containing protein [Chlorobiaceae bacterium]|nr:DUF3570 domain-containing protein [Chlorobiaceae bacterium]
MKPASSIKSTKVIGAALTAAAMFLPSAKPAFADAAPERGIVAFKYLSYRDSQPDVDRININAYSVRAMTPIAGKWAIDVTGVLDSVTGASPHYYSFFDTVSGASKLKADTRKALDLSVTRYFPTGSLTAGTSYSEESDYISRSISLQGSVASPSKNTTVTLGGSVTTDTITPNNIELVDRKKIYSALLGVTQVMSKNDIVQVNLSRSVGEGYYTDPYRPIDNRPRHRNYTTVMTKWNHYFESTEGASRLAYRYYADTFGIRSHTFSAEYVQPLPNDFKLMPSVRLYSQTAADFYVPVDPLYAPEPPEVNFDGYYTLDQRLSAFGAVTLGLKVSKKFADEWLVDVRYDHCMQRDHWAISGKGDSGLAPFNMDFIQVGLSKEF